MFFDDFFGDGQAKYLFGEARLYLGEYETDPGKFREVEPGDDARMAYADALFVMQQLRNWSSAHEIEWEVQLGSTRGVVNAQGPDAGAEKLLADLQHRAGNIAPQAAESDRERLDAKYRDRR